MVKLKKNELDRLICRLAGSYDVYAPVDIDGNVEFARVSSAEDMDQSRTVTNLSPKEIFFPKDEVLFEYDADGIRPADSMDRPIAVWGIRSCDTKSLMLLDKVFGSAIQMPKEERFQDPYWKKRYDGALLFGAACAEPLSTCFCNWFGGGPFATEGMDVHVTDIGDAFLLNPVTPRGEDYLESLDFTAEVSESDRKAAAEIAGSAEAVMSPPVPIDGLDQLLPGLFLQEEVWGEVSAACINCGACTFVCPTCHCFDMQDEGRNEKGRRLRVWDSCMFPIFTSEASGHNPRSLSRHRVRQRVMHKYSYYPVNYGEYLCTGCGRCITVCPVNVDIRRTLLKLMTHDGEDG